MTAPLISVAIPMYNAARTIDATLRSALAQSYERFEVIVIDDGSTDGAAAIAAAVADPRVRINRQSNAGVAAARNAAIDLAHGEYVAFLDADDVWNRDHLQVLVSAALQFPDAGLIANSFAELLVPGQSPASSLVKPADAKARQLDDFVARWARGEARLHTSTSMAKADAARSVGGFRKGYSRGEDLEFFLRLSQIAPVVMTGYMGAFYVRSPDGLTGQPVAKPDICMTTLDQLIDTCTDPIRRRALQEFHARLALAHAMDNLLAGDRETARAFLRSCTTTTWHRRRWLSVKYLSLLPRPVIRALFASARAARAAFRG